MAGLRIGIDVGGTFTHGVVLRPPGEVLCTARTPTTHTAQRGVAEGVKTVLRELVAQINPADVELVAHSTTQATNALLEGDVSPVIRHVIVPPGEGVLTRRALREQQLDIGNGHRLVLHTIFTDHASAQGWEVPADYEGRAEQLPVAMIQPLAGNADNLESVVADKWRGAGHSVVCASEITQVLGLQARLRTACVNASMLPAMVATAEFTAQAVDEVLPGVPVQVVRSDGGAMSLDEMRRMPVLSLLSGPAAGASAALHRTGLSEVVFIEVGGTSTDITLIREGKVRHRYATVGGQRLMVPALDLRTVAVGGGSMLRADGSRFGPRSAHKAGLPYLFQAIEAGLHVDGLQQWRDSTDNDTYICARMSDNSLAALTLTDYAFGTHGEGMREAVSENLGLSFTMEQCAKLAHPFLDQSFSFNCELAKESCISQIESAILDLWKSHGIGNEMISSSLRAGGGGAVAVTPFINSLFLGGVLKTEGDLKLDDHTVISAIGAALAVTCVSQSKSVAEPTSGDIAELVTAVETKLREQGAERVSTEYEYDPQRQVLTVTGRGNRPYDQESQQLDETGLQKKARELLGDNARQAWSDGSTSLWLADGTEAQSQTGRQKAEGKRQKGTGSEAGDSCTAAGNGTGSSAPRLPKKAGSWWQRLTGGARRGTRALALHNTGRSLWCGTLSEWSSAQPGGLEAELHRIIEQRTQYTDGGPALPGLALLCDGRLIPLDSLGSRELIDDILRFENLPPSAGCCFILRN